mgnify:CR=1 FL=1
MRIGIIGLGKMGMLHAAIVNSLPEAELVAIAEPTEFIKSALQVLTPDIQVYQDYREMITKSDLQGVFITTPVHLHIPQALDCVKEGLPVFIEKPLSCTAKEAEQLVELVEAKKVVSMIGYGAYYFDMFRKGKEIIDAGVLGKLLNFGATLYVSQIFTSRKGWRYKRKEAGGGVLNNLTSHLIFTLLWYFGEVEEVVSLVEKWYSENVEDYFHSLIYFKSGLKGWVDSSWSMDNYRLPRAQIEIHGTNGRLSIGDDYVKLFLREGRDNYPAGWSQWRGPDLYQGVSINIGGEQFTREDQAFLQAIEKQQIPFLNISWGYRVQKVIDAIYLSGENNGQKIKIN